MKFLPYEDVPLVLHKDGKVELVFAESASLSVSQPLETNRQIDDNILQICSYGTNSNAVYTPQLFTANESFSALLGPSGGPAQPLSTSIYKVVDGTKITFPNNKHLYFSGSVWPNGNDYIVDLYSKSGGWSLSIEEAQSGYFESIHEYSASNGIKGTLDVNFYTDTGNLSSFFDITGLSDPAQYPPIDEDPIMGSLGDFIFLEAYLTNFNFSLSPNSISQASASFDIYGDLVKSDLLKIFWENNMQDYYKNKSIAHGQYSTIKGVDSLDLEHPISFNYNISVERSPRYVIPTGNLLESVDGIVPSRVSKKSTTITMSVEGENFDPEITFEGYFHGRGANLTANIFDLSYSGVDYDSLGFMHSFNCSGVVTSESLSISSDGYLNGTISVMETVR